MSVLFTSTGTTWFAALSRHTQQTPLLSIPRKLTTRATFESLAEPRNAATNKEMAKQYYCGNNELSRKLKTNGGHMEFGSPSLCQKKGFGIGFNQHITNSDEYLREWGPYRPHIVQKLYCGDEPRLPSGYDARATLPQCLARGFGLGSVKRAKKLRASSRATDKHKTPRPTSPRTAQKHPEGGGAVRLPIRKKN